MPVITISRQYGSGGTEIAKRVCSKLGYSYFDKNLMARVASEVGLAEHDIVDFSEDTYKMRSLFERMFGRRSTRSDSINPERRSPFQVEALDEATSALDYDTERRVCNNLVEALHDCTVFFITHRLSTIRRADRIVMMHQGAVVETGSHQELMDLQGRYFALYRQQEAN